MADQKPDQMDNAPASAAPAPGQQAVSFNIVAQYIRDLSYESPSVPAVLFGTDRPEGKVQIDVRTRAMPNKQFEVGLVLRAEASRAGQRLYLIELDYAGLFAVEHQTPQVVELLLMVEAPRLLFPFARAILGGLVRDGGFPPLNIQPVDFLGLYQQRRQQRAQQNAATPAPEAVTTDNG